MSLVLEHRVKCLHFGMMSIKTSCFKSILLKVVYFTYLENPLRAIPYFPTMLNIFKVFTIPLVWQAFSHHEFLQMLIKAD